MMMMMIELKDLFLYMVYWMCMAEVLYAVL